MSNFTTDKSNCNITTRVGNTDIYVSVLPTYVQCMSNVGLELLGCEKVEKFKWRSLVFNSELRQYFRLVKSFMILLFLTSFLSEKCTKISINVNYNLLKTNYVKCKQENIVS